MPKQLPVILTIAGSDSGGGAGIQADVKAISACGAWGASAITCITAQNLSGVSRIDPVPAEGVYEQISQVCNGFPVSAAKTGMLYSAEIITAAANAIKLFSIPKVVVDPVMVATSGAKLLKDDAVQALREVMIPKAFLVTPNIPEAEILTGITISSADDIDKAAKKFYSDYGVPVLIKGGHGFKGVDFLFDGKHLETITVQWVDIKTTHGTGCTLSAAIAAWLGKGKDLSAAVRAAKQYITAALREYVIFDKNTSGLGFFHGYSQ